MSEGKQLRSNLRQRVNSVIGTRPGVVLLIKDDGHHLHLGLICTRKKNRYRMAQAHQRNNDVSARGIYGVDIDIDGGKLKLDWEIDLMITQLIERS